MSITCISLVLMKFTPFWTRWH